MIFISFYLLSFFLALTIFSYLNIARDKLLNYNQSSKHGIDKNSNSRMGGILLFLYIMFASYSEWYDLKNNYLLEEYLFFMLILTFITFLGFVDDIIGGLNHIIKLYFLLFAIVFLLISYKILLVESSGNIIIDSFLSVKLISYLVTLLIILGFINASNIADGANGILSGISSIFFLIIFLETNLKIYENIFYLMFIFFIYNILVSRVYLGDSGSYLIGFLISTISLYYYNQDFISAGMLASLLSYPCLEISFSIIRRFNIKQNPLKPDNKHLHNILFYYFKQKLFSKWNENFANSFTGFFILLTFSAPALIFYLNSKSLLSEVYWYIFLLQIFFYAYFYFYLIKINTKYD